MGEMTRAAVRRSNLATQARRAPESASRGSRDHEGRDAPASLHLVGGQMLQPSLMLGAANDPFEQEAEQTAEAVTSTGAPPAIAAGGIAARLMRFVRRALGKNEPPTHKDDDERPKHVQKEAAGGASGPVPAGVEARIDAMTTSGGAPLPDGLRAVFEPRFGFDFTDVRVHTSHEAADASRKLGARAFTVGDHVFFGAGEFQPSSREGQKLIAHELTHTIQQKPAAARAARTSPVRATGNSGAATGSVSVRAAPKRVQRLFEGVAATVREKVRDFITLDFPPWELITLIIGWDPLQDHAVKGSTRDWIHAAMKLAPDGEALFARLDGEGRIEAIAKWWDAEVSKLNLTFDGLVALLKQAWDAVSVTDLASPRAAWNQKVKPILQPTITRVWDFIKAVGSKVYEIVKSLVLDSISAWAQQQKGYTLLTFVLGRDPVTGEPVKRTAKGLIYAVLDLVDGGDKIKENLEKSKTIEKASAWFSEEVKKLDLTWDGIKALFSKAWDAFKVADLLQPKVLFEKMAEIFGPPLGRLLDFLIAVGKKVLELIFEGAMLLAGPIGLQIAGIFRKIGDAFNLIVADPVAFVGHLVDAVKKGIEQFGKNIWEHLKTGLIEWLVGTLEGAGLVLPKVWDLHGILDLVLQILGITYAKIREKLVKVLGEKTVSMLEKAFVFLKTLVTEGPAAAWKQIVEAIGSLWDMVIGGIKDWAVTKIVTAAITKLATMFNPAGAVIQAIIATYNTVAFFIERIKQILAFVESVVDSISNIAHGKIAQAANYVERAMARTIPVILGFLARLIGLGDVSEAIKKVITGIQQKVDKGIDAVIKWVVEKAKSIVGKGGEKDEEKGDENHDEKWKAGVAGVTAEMDKLDDEGVLDDAKLQASLPVWKKTYGFSALLIEGSKGNREIDGAMSPGKKVASLGNMGTKSDPFPLSYPKPRNLYEPVYLFDERTEPTKDQKAIKKLYDDPLQRAKRKVSRYVPFPSGPQALPNGKSIGIRGKYALDVGSLVGPLKAEGTPGGSLINDNLARFGMQPSVDDLQGDHFWEIQYGGDNVLENLWPLDRSANNASGNYLKNLEVTLPSGKKKKVSELKGNVRPYWFEIKQFKRP
ncbi:eCIS core domain-containing protein [Paraburkholderia youngii]|uniref:eCIS core domain-containing protein n=1 Tax=Paraburkholderia youngii TaxID=2782701 RepID=UPI003D217E53